MKVLLIGSSDDGEVIYVETLAPVYQRNVVDNPGLFALPSEYESTDVVYHRETYRLEVIRSSRNKTEYYFYVHEDIGEGWIAELVNGYRRPLPKKRELEAPYGR